MLAAVDGSGLKGAEVVGVPVRSTITGLDRAGLRAQARAHFGFAEDARVLLVFGGSQGAASINRAVSGAAEALAANNIAVLHAHGPKNVLELRTPGPGDPPYVAVPYLDRMDLAYAAADLAICRSGAMTVAEVSAVGLPAVYVPLPIGNGEQRLNALPVVDAGGGLLVADADLTPAYVAETVAGLLTDGPRLAQMTTAAAAVGHRDAAARVAAVAVEIARAARAGPVDERAAARGTAPGPHGGHRRGRYVRHRPHPAGPGCAGVRFRRQGVPGVVALRARGALINIGHDAAALDLLPGAPRRSSPPTPRSPRPTRNWWRRAAGRFRW